MEEETSQKRGRDYLLPVSIVIAAVLISGSLLYNVGAKKNAVDNTVNTAQTAPPEEVLRISDSDHVRGSANAQIKIFEYSDLECPFCQQFHVTMKKIIADYGDRVAWVYRHFPIVQLHPKAPKEAEASECAYEQGGNDAFWAYTDRLFEITPANNGLDLALLPKIAEHVGLDVASFSACLASGKYTTFIAEQAKASQDVMTASCQEPNGRCGTPYSLIVGEEGKWYPLNGAYPYDALKQILDQMLSQ